jgi:hypothetical protein
MSVGTAVTILNLLLQLSAFFARKAERDDIAKAVLNELENLHGKRVDSAVAARDDVMSGRVQPKPDDPYRRD